MMILTTTTDTATATVNPYGNYDPGDMGNWDNIGPWFASVIFALILAPLCWQQFVTWVKWGLAHV